MQAKWEWNGKVAFEKRGLGGEYLYAGGSESFPVMLEGHRGAHNQATQMVGCDEKVRKGEINQPGKNLDNHGCGYFVYCFLVCFF